MNLWLKRLTPLAYLLLGTAVVSLGQASPTASRMLDLSSFGGITETQTGLAGGRNLAITSGLDLGFKAYRGYEFYLEGRATLALEKGPIVGQNVSLGGLRIERHMSGIHPYGDFLFGHGDLNYQSGGFHAANRYIYYKTDSYVISVGAGAEVRMTDNVYLILDVQAQHWNSPVAPGGSMTSMPVLFGFVYHLPCRKNGHPYP